MFTSPFPFPLVFASDCRLQGVILVCKHKNVKCNSQLSNNVQTSTRRRVHTYKHTHTNTHTHTHTNTHTHTKRTHTHTHTPGMLLIVGMPRLPEDQQVHSLLQLQFFQGLRHHYQQQSRQCCTGDKARCLVSASDSTAHS